MRDSGDNTLAGNGGDDTILGGAGVDTIEGGEGDDFLDSGPGGDGLDTVTAVVKGGMSSTASVVEFFDDFNRPDGVVGSGWLDAVDNANGNIFISGGHLAVPSAGVTTNLQALKRFMERP